MREIRQSGSEGGGDSVSPYPYHVFVYKRKISVHRRNSGPRHPG
jgi:hypothetical protein